MRSFDVFDEYGYADYKILDKVLKKTLKMEKVGKAYFSIVFIDDVVMQELNKNYRGIDRTTDVLSFAFEDNEKQRYNIRQLGEIFISIPKMKAQALEYGHSEVRELAFLAVHGLLHLLGYDHTKSKEEEEIMFKKQELILNGCKETKRT